MILLALLLPAVLGAIALAADVSVFYFQWAQLQKAADAAALAGVSKLPTDTAGAITVAKSYAQQNGIQASEITSTTFGAGNTTMTVTLTRVVPYYFAAVFGLTNSPVVVRATASLVAAGSATGALPVGLDSRTTYSFGQQLALIQGTQGSYGPGDWGALSLGGTGANNFANNVTGGYSGSINVGDLLTTEPGKIVGPTQGAFNSRIQAGLASDPGGTYGSHTLDDARVVTIPVVNFANINGQSQVPVIGFAEIWLVSVSNQAVVTAIFIQQIIPNSNPIRGGTTYGANRAILIQ